MMGLEQDDPNRLWPKIEQLSETQFRVSLSEEDLPKYLLSEGFHSIEAMEIFCQQHRKTLKAEACEIISEESDVGEWLAEAYAWHREKRTPVAFKFNPAPYRERKWTHLAHWRFGFKITLHPTHAMLFKLRFASTRGWE